MSAISTILALGDFVTFGDKSAVGKSVVTLLKLLVAKGEEHAISIGIGGRIVSGLVIE